MERDGAPRPGVEDIEPVPPATAQRVARAVLAGALALLGIWILRRFLAALAWATILAIALWPLYRRAAGAPRDRRILLPLAATSLVGLVLIVPLVYAAVEIARESGNLIGYVAELRHNGMPMPPWLPQVPGIGHPLAAWWKTHLSDPQTMRELFGRVVTRIPARSAREIGVEIVHRLIIFGFTLLTLFFLFRDGPALGSSLQRLSQNLLGPGGERVARHMIAAVHGTVTGLVLVGLAEGVVIGFAYAWVGLPHTVLFAAVTGVVAVIPFGAPVAFCGAALYLAAQGNTGAAAIVVIVGFLVVFIADHFVRPFLIGGAARLPFLWVLLGIIGGLETFGLLGLFLGPVVMAALISLWRDWSRGVDAGDTPPPRASGRRRR